MKRYLIALAAIAALAIPVRALAATEYILVYTNYNPYYTETVGGPFETSQECYAVLNANSYRPGGSYSCRMIFV